MHKDHYEFEEIEDHSPWWKKLLIGILAFFLLFLMVSYFIGGGLILDIFRGQLMSEEIEDFKVDVDGNISVEFTEDSYNRLLKYYLENQRTEFKACLTGEIKNNLYFVKDVYWPEQVAQFNQVSYQPCNQDTIVSLHAHPFKHCIPSEQDTITAREYKKENPKAIMAILCEPARLTFYEI